MEPAQGIEETIKNNGLIGAGILTVLTFAYKMWRVMKSDRSTDQIDSEEQRFRDMLREELDRAKTKLEALTQENTELKQRIAANEVRLEYTQKLLDSHNAQILGLGHENRPDSSSASNNQSS